MIWFERKVISDMQSRIGPNRAGPWGIAQTLADGIKLFFKEDLLPDQADPFVFKLAPYLSIIPAVLIFAIVPVGGVITIGGHTFELQLADPPMGILFVLAMSGIARLRRHAGRLVVGLEVPAARLGAGLGPDDLLRGGPRHDHRHGGPGHRLALHPGHRASQAGRPLALEPHPARLRALHLLHDRHHGRAQPAALRPDRGRPGAGRRASTPSTPPSASPSSSWPSS